MIYTEVVHLDADNKVLIEVLDGRSVRLTTDAHPCEVWYDKKKVVSININGQPYLSLDTYDKVFVMINGKLHTYDITEIDQIGDNVFQCHTMLRTKSSFFVTPMLGETRNEFKWSQYFVNTFLHNSNKIVILYRFFDVEDYKQFEHALKKHQRYIGTVDYDLQHVAMIFKVPDEHLQNLKHFKEGQYSQMNIAYKEHVLKFHNLTKDTLIGRVLFKADERRKQLELDLGVTIPPDVELYDKPDESEIFHKKIT
jgi:hypothetical protein